MSERHSARVDAFIDCLRHLWKIPGTALAVTGNGKLVHMRDVLLDAIPADRRETARPPLGPAFGSAPLTALQRASAGASAFTYRIELVGPRDLLRLESPGR